ncbi:MAG TPA: ferredoxin [Verrucomicrobiales bacterium]|jgi:ABC-type methionine transport system ATPase subunit|nr:ferredoxin [Verrucomicrobiales bacterium]
MASPSKKKTSRAVKKKVVQTKRKTSRSANDLRETRRLWLMYPSKLITSPIIWQLGQKFKVETNVRQVSVTDEIGIVCLELNGKRSEITSAIKWLEKKAISVEPVEINVIES